MNSEYPAVSSERGLNMVTSLTSQTQIHLFICKHEQHGISQLILSQHSHQLLLRLTHSLSVITVHYKDEA